VAAELLSGGLVRRAPMVRPMPRSTARDGAAAVPPERAAGVAAEATEDSGQAPAPARGGHKADLRLRREATFRSVMPTP
jgi:hypothetical protein